ncbi:DASS family sodium-coupled anion symporter [Sulfobacillus acidophilus]|uniref:DASS family sodium-coupled anion symporter n=1 Tax=Sulfobacillus acidophilus TaxID=53633 RepID=A0ABS3AVM1_9FIRM|nr:DASS family sodium-coupled anion symporter [Sulfobacillus acidophilus]
MNNKSKLKGLVLAICVGLLIWLVPTPPSLDNKAMLLLAIFVSTILAVILNALPMGAATLMGLTVAVVTKTLSFSYAFAGYTNPIVWLILSAFFIAYGFIHTGLGQRIAYFFVAIFGKKTLGLAYGLSFTELLLAPAIPSVTARSGGIVYPITQALCFAFKSNPDNGTQKKLGSYLIIVVFQATVITSAMFLTAMAANPLAAKFAGDLGIHITWALWAKAAIVPGLVSLLVMPWFIFKIYPPQITETPGAVLFAKEKLAQMGPMKRSEILMSIGFFGLLAMWTFGSFFNISATEAALIGLAFLIITGVIKWSELLKLHNAWETFIWFGALIALAQALKDFGLASYFSSKIAELLTNTNLFVATALLFLIYFYIHYFFASSTAHVSALFLPMLMVAVGLGAPKIPTAILFAAGSSLFGGLTHYGIGPAPILFGSNFVPLKDWWKIGFLVSLVNIAIWAGVGFLWWRFLGLY